MRVSELRGALEDALGPTYRVEREVRPVGECRLFVAVGPPTDPELLVKVLPAELSLAVDAAVFEREVLLLGDRLGHAQLVPPRGSGRAGAFVYHARRFVEGTTLRAWLANHGEMPLRRVIEVLRDVLLALAHAHRGSIAHGDLRPENVLLTAGRVQVADTGIVDAVGRAVPSALAGGVGATLCAPAYLAPERRKNGGAGGPRDDMFAVGVLLHEMLTGEPPAVEGESLEEVRSLPPWLAELARRCLTPEPTARWPDAAAALDPAPAGSPRLAHRGAGAGARLRLRIAHRLPCTPHLARGRPRGRRAGSGPGDARPPAGRLGGTRRRLSLRCGGRAGRAAGAERGLRARLRRCAGERRRDARATHSGLRVGRLEGAAGAGRRRAGRAGTVRRTHREPVRGRDELDVEIATGAQSTQQFLTVHP